MICFFNNAISNKYVNKIIKLRRLWGIQKNTEAVGKWDPKKEELEKKIRKNNLEDFESINTSGKIAMKLEKNDKIIGVNLLCCRASICNIR